MRSHPPCGMDLRPLPSTCSESCVTTHAAEFSSQTLMRCSRPDETLCRLSERPACYLRLVGFRSHDDEDPPAVPRSSPTSQPRATHTRGASPRPRETILSCPLHAVQYEGNGSPPFCPWPACSRTATALEDLVHVRLTVLERRLQVLESLAEILDVGGEKLGLVLQATVDIGFGGADEPRNRAR